MLCASVGEHVTEANEKILPKMDTIKRFITHFAAHYWSSKAVFGEAAKAADMDDHANEQEEDAALQLGLSNAAAKKVDDFLPTVSSLGKMLVTILAKIHGGAFDDDFFCHRYSGGYKCSFQFSVGAAFQR